MSRFVKILSVVFLSAAAAGPAGAGTAVSPAALNFDQGFDLAAALRAAEAGPALPVPETRAFMNALRSTRDCKFFTFKAGDPLVSRPARLKSFVFQPVWQAGQSFDQLLRTEKRTVVVSLTGTAILPWEKEVFSVCLKDTAVSIEAAEASHQYEFTKKPGLERYEVNAAAVARIKGEPDPAGITAASWGVSPATGSLELVLRDKWAGVYGAAGLDERTAIKLTVRQDAPSWFDGVVLEKEILIHPAELYTFDLSRYAAEFRRPLEAGLMYYVQWGFRRDGGISKSSFVQGGETARALLPPR